MRILVLLSLTMLAFASNSILNRVALATGVIGPSSFAGIRVLSGAVMLSLLMLATRYRWPRIAKPNWWQVLALSAYFIALSHAFLSLDTGFGALLQFALVQITMFVGAVMHREAMGLRKWLGALIAFGGLAYLLNPTAANFNWHGSLLMAVAAVGWGVYSLLGKATKDPLEQTTVNFIWSAPFAVAAWLLVPDTQTTTMHGLSLAVLSGAITSGIGYAIWYSLIPQMQRSTAALAQLTVPIIAAAGGIAFLGEVIDLRFIIASLLVLGGLWLSTGQRGK